MVTDAQRRAAQAVRRAMACVGRLAVLSGSRLRLLDPGAYGGADAQVRGVRGEGLLAPHR